jgi:hypothetical protein
VKTSDGKLDFAANIQRNPAILSAPNPFASAMAGLMPVNPYVNPAMNPAQQRIPQWAMPQNPMMQQPMYPQNPAMMQQPMYPQQGMTPQQMMQQPAAVSR